MLMGPITIPMLMSIAKIDELTDEISKTAETYLKSSKEISDIIALLKNIEELIDTLPSSHFKHGFDPQEIDVIRIPWINGESISGKTHADSITNDYFGFTIPWVLNAISKKYIMDEKEEEAGVFEELASLCELGLPSNFAVKIYLSGIRSREAATELSKVFNSQLASESLSEIPDIIVRNTDKLVERKLCSEKTLRWIEILAKNIKPSKKKITRIPDFTFSDKNFTVKTTQLFCKTFESSCFLCCSDFKEKIQISVTEDFPFDKIADLPGIFFEFEDNVWKMKIKNPNYQF